MLNLLMREDRHAIRKEYILRFFTVFVILLIILSLILSVIMFSFYLQTNVESKILENDLEEIMNSSSTQDLNDLSDLNQEIDGKLSQLNVLGFDQSDILKEIIVKNRSGININLISINLEKNENQVFDFVCYYVFFLFTNKC